MGLNSINELGEISKGLNFLNVVWKELDPDM
jgi:hypothetical protein